MSINLIPAGLAASAPAWGGSGLEESDMRKKIAMAMAMQSMAPDQIGTKAGIASKVLQGAYAGMAANRDAQDNAAATQTLMDTLVPGGGAPAPAAAPGIFGGITKALAGLGGGSPGAIGADAPPVPVPPQAAAEAAPVDGVVQALAGAPSGDILDKIKKFEGFAPKAAWDYKQNTNGYGTRAASPGEVIDPATAEARLRDEVAKASGIVDKFKPDLAPGVRDALTSLTYNAGDKWTRSGLGQAIQTGDMAAAKDRFLQYNKAGGQTLPGLVNRRQQEAQWFEQPGAPNAPTRVASLGGGPTPDSPAPAAQPPAGQPVQLAQTGGPPPQVGPQRQQMTIPPEVGQQIRSLLANPRTRQYGIQIYQQYAKPQEPSFDRLNDDTLYNKKDGTTMSVPNSYRPIVDPAERSKYGIPTHDTRPYQLGPGNKLVNPPAETRVNIDQKAESAFDTQAATHQVKRFDAIVQTGFDAKTNRADVNALREIGARIPGGTGKTPEIIAALGPYAEAMGIKVDGLGDMQAFEAIVNKMAPRQRAPGSGSTSDFEGRQFLKGLPTLGKTPEGNELIENTMTALQDHQERAAEIASRALNKELSPRDADKLLRELPDPWTAFKEYRKQQGNQPAAGANPPPAPNGAPSREQIEQEMRSRGLLK